MFRFLERLLGFDNRLFGAQRNPHWPKIRASYMKQHPKCEILCGKKATDCHHILPVHLFPNEELNPQNFLAVCEDCHFIFGHFFNYRSYNKDIRNDIQRIKNRP